jgi:integrase
MAAYQAALVDGTLPAKISKTTPQSLAWLIERYRETTAWSDLSPATRRNRENHFKAVLKTAGHRPYRDVNQKVIVAGRDKRSHTPAQARNFLDAMRGLFKWAKEAQHVPIDPAAQVKNPKRKKGPGFPIWTDTEVERYYARWPLGTKERLWFSVLLNTGLRRGDAVRLGRQHLRDGVLTIRTEKTGTEVWFDLSKLPELQQAIEVGPIGDMTFIVGANNRPMTKESFGNAFAEACRAAGVKKSSHGLRKLASTRDAENGASGPQLNATYGWRGTAMASLYTEAADRKRLALMREVRTPNESATSILPPNQKVGAREPKAK